MVDDLGSSRVQDIAKNATRANLARLAKRRLDAAFPSQVPHLARYVIYLKKSGSVCRVGIFLDFVRRSGTTTCAPWGAHVRRAKRNRVDHRSPIILPLFCRYATGYDLEGNAPTQGPSGTGVTVTGEVIGNTTGFDKSPYKSSRINKVWGTPLISSTYPRVRRTPVGRTFTCRWVSETELTAAQELLAGSP